MAAVDVEVLGEEGAAGEAHGAFGGEAARVETGEESNRGALAGKRHGGSRTALGESLVLDILYLDRRALAPQEGRMTRKIGPRRQRLPGDSDLHGLSIDWRSCHEVPPLNRDHDHRNSFGLSGECFRDR